MKRFQLTSAFQSFFSTKALLLTVIVIISLAYFSGLLAVPFHPDETTHIFMSADLEELIYHPDNLVWHSGQSLDLKTHYRLVDPPLNRYLIGIIRKILNVHTLEVDWDWSLSWDMNVNRGAMPSTSQLLAGRLVSAVFFPFSLVLVFLLGRKIHSQAAGWAALLIFASSSLILLHTRRAMAESSLIFFTLLSLWFILRYTDRPWLSAIPLALAFNAKYSAVPLLLVGILNIAWRSKSTRFTEVLEDLGFFLFIFGSITFALNPFLWGNPVQAFLAAIDQRTWLVSTMESGLQTIYPDLGSAGGLSQLLINFINLFFAKPAIQDIGNYTNELQMASQIYFSNPLHLLWSGLVFGSILLFLTILGLFLSIRQSIKDQINLRANLLFIIAGISEFLGITILLSLPFQRYILPLIPFVCLWSGISISQIFHVIRQLTHKKAA